jgi:hypothetical protein
MAEKAARLTADVVPVYVANLAANPPVQVTTWQDLIARYQEKFMPPAAGVYSRAEYNIAKQISSEDVGGWHARLQDPHQKSACPVWDKALTLARKESGGSSAHNRRTGGSGGAGRERANYCGRSTSGPRPSNNTLSTTAPARAEAPSPVPEGADPWADSENKAGQVRPGRPEG